MLVLRRKGRFIRRLRALINYVSGTLCTYMFQRIKAYALTSSILIFVGEFSECLHAKLLSRSGETFGRGDKRRISRRYFVLRFGEREAMRRTAVLLLRTY